MQKPCSSFSCHSITFNDIENRTVVSEFILLGFHVMPNLRIFLFYLILLSYTFTVLGNFIILYLVFSDPRLHFPMYYFLCNLAVMDICFTNTVVPGMLKGFVSEGLHISVQSCLAQTCIYFLIGTAEFLLFAVMSLDRYLAICLPLRYSMIMHKHLYNRLIAGVWLGSFFSTALTSGLAMKLKYCNKFIDHFFCDASPLLKNSCTDTSMIELLSLFSANILYISVLVTLISYMKILLEVLKVNTAEGRGRALSTCSSHAIVVTLIYSSCIYLYATPAQGQRAHFNKDVAILNTVVVPLLNPFIYTLRNLTVRKSLSDMLVRIFNKHESSF